ncbi:MAG: hypothetical protein ACLPXT_06975 [Terracidiphilus sp.]
MTSKLKEIGGCCLVVLIALYVVGAVSHGSLRHLVQTLPLCFPIVLGFKRRESARWSALPCLVFWLGIMAIIWLYLLGWAHIVSGHFSPVEIAMTLIVGAASALGISLCLRRARWSARGAALVVLFAVLQILALRISLFPAIAHQ